MARRSPILIVSDAIAHFHGGDIADEGNLEDEAKAILEALAANDILRDCQEPHPRADLTTYCIMPVGHVGAHYFSRRPLP